MFFVGLAVPPYGLPSTDPTPPGFAFSDRGGLGSHEPTSLLTGRGRLTPTKNMRSGNSPLNQCSSRSATY
jgi:hypothetical protein